MSDLRWLLLAAGLIAFGLIFWLTRREQAGKPVRPSAFLRRTIPMLGGTPPVDSDPGVGGAPALGEPAGTASSAVPEPERIITVRLTGHANATFSAETLFVALREAGLRHGRFGIFHRVGAADDGIIVFSVASLVEPGAFDLARAKTDRLPGVSFFLPLPAIGDSVAAFDDMLATARALAIRLDGQLLDERGNRLSVQRERFLREEVIQFQHKRSSA